MRTLFYSIAVLFSVEAAAQVPFIQKVEPLSTFPGDTVIISGNGFHDDKTNLEVWFDNVEGEIVSSTVYNIEVIVPAEARAANVEVINKVSKLSGKSHDKFTPNYEGVDFSETKFGTPLIFTANEELWDLCNCDFDGDSKPDIAATKFTRPGSPFSFPSDLMVLHNTSTPGALSFTKFDKANLAALNLTFPSDNVVCGDLDGDGKPELIATRAGSTRNSVHIWKNNSTPGTIAFANQTALFMADGLFATRMALKDLNKDGKPEIIATNSFNDIFYVFINQSTGGNLSFTSSPLTLSIKIEETDQLKTYETDVQDFNGDGLPDIVINQFQTKDIYLLKNISEGSIKFAPPQKIALTGNFNRIASADFNKDGLLDLVVTNTILDKADVLINASTAETFAFNTSVALSTSFEPWGVDIADIDGDDDTDIIVANKNKQLVDVPNRKLNIFLNNGGATPTFTRVDIATNQPTRNIKVNDFDGDGKPDIAFTGFNESTTKSQLTIIRNTNCQQARILNEETNFCSGRTVRLQARPDANSTFNWEKDAVAFGTGASVDITLPGTYKVTVTNGVDACTSSAQITMVQDVGVAPAMPTISTNGPVCVNGTLNLSSDANVSLTPSWTGPNNFVSSAQAPSISSVNIAAAGEYTLQVTAANGCKSGIATAIVDVSDLSEFQISSPVAGDLCVGSSVNLTVNNPPNHSFQWRKNGVDIANATTSTLTVTEDGAYTVFISNDDLINCTTETLPSDVNILALPQPSFDVASESVCEGVEVAFTNNSTVDERATIVYTWNFDDASGTSADENPVHTFASSGSYDVSLSIQYTGVTGCSANTSQPVVVAEPVLPEIIASAESACPDGEVELSVAETFSSVTWSTEATTASINTGPGDYSVTTVDENGCSGTDDISIATLDLPVISIDAGRTSIPAGDTTQLLATGGVTYVWNASETLSSTTIANPIASPLETTVYTVTGTAANSCTGQGQITITVSGTLGFPPAFSPNGDGDNETWNIRAESAPDCLLTIYNGNGSKVFEKMGENWDGTYNGNIVPSGTYYYVYSCPNAKSVTGSVLVFK
jgi:gliding motility-associated-like protein